MSPTSANKTPELARQIRALPRVPGVYVFRDADDAVLYVGKAKSLRSRVRSYFGSAAARSLKLRELARRCRRIETFVVGSEAEALLLEANLIKEFRPRFNIQLRDDKNYPYVKVTVGEIFPRVLVTRRRMQDGSRYFGPYTDVGAMRSALRLLRRIYTVRSCHYDLPRTAPARPCLDYHIGRCRAPCVGLQSEMEYRTDIEQVLQVLSGHTGALKKEMRAQMQRAARELSFERAAELRDVVRGLESIERRQTAVDFRGGDRDVIGIGKLDALAIGVIWRVREGRLLGREVVRLDNVEQADSKEMTAALVKGFYLRQEDLPPELLVSTDFEDRELVQDTLARRRGGAFSIHVPQRGRKRRLLDIASRNAAHLAGETAAQLEAMPGDGAQPSGEGAGPVPKAAAELADQLELDAPPRALLCFDISTLGGADSVGSAVWLENGRPLRSAYRRFRIRLGEGRPDDPGMMQEVVMRYFTRRVREGARLPDLVVVDGGLGQLGAALHAMEAAGVSDLPLVALAKREEEIYRPGIQEALRLPRRAAALHWLQRARDEAHRFAVTYNRTLRRRRTLRSKLSTIPGIGAQREKALLQRFGSVRAIAEATAGELARTPGIGLETAKRIRRTLKSEAAG